MKQTGFHVSQLNMFVIKAGPGPATVVVTVSAAAAWQQQASSVRTRAGLSDFLLTPANLCAGSWPIAGSAGPGLCLPARQVGSSLGDI